ncbi:GDP-mannose 4,6 dehydratase [Gordonibacter sp. 28C]|uniref:GDP-mannose 4,6-dehydratase n=1 Tax=Gordonibacter sp. 28C TaxID=2078569 RepID=UPI000DF76525|nr:GDP-mannose 4,6-dehydratase [Gordonibacter sp. 28C]RDB58975.1 GDP-mannose 4,6 dehydratase [Gordonibacter sp. 28C]
MADNTVLVIGVNGFVGSYVAQEFAASGYRVLGADRSSSCMLEAVESFRTLDVCDPEKTKKTVASFAPDIIVNLAAVSSVGVSWAMPGQTMAVNVIGSINVLESAKDLDNAPKILMVGSSEEYAPSGAPLTEDSPLSANSPYGISKSAQERFAELYAERYGLRVYRTRSFNHTGIGQSETFVIPSFCKQIAAISNSGKSGIVHVGNLSVRRDFSDVRDIARAYRMIVESECSGEVFNVGSGRALALSDLLNLMIADCPNEVRIEADVERTRVMDCPLIVADISKIRECLGWRPSVPIEATIREMLDYWRRSHE